MKVADIMTRSVIVIGPSTTLRDAARLMLEHQISGLPVVDADGRAVGMLTEADLLRRGEIGTDTQEGGWRAFFADPERLANEYVHMHARSAGEVMSRQLVAVEPDTPLAEAVELMHARGFKRLPVLSGERVVGILSRADLLRVLAKLLSGPASPVSASDTAIRQSIVAQLHAQRWCPTSLLNVEVRDGRAELHGVVTSQAEREALRVLVSNTPGVREVIDQLIWVEPYTGITVDLPAEPGS